MGRDSNLLLLCLRLASHNDVAWMMCNGRLLMIVVRGRKIPRMWKGRGMRMIVGID
jgi:hypothetical protein